MKVSRSAKLTAALMAFAVGACGDDDDKKKSASVAERTVENMLAEACTKGEDGAYTECSRSAPSSFWQLNGPSTWNENAQEFTVVNYRRAVDGDAADYNKNNWYVKDSEGNVITDKVINLTQGVPTIIHYEQPTITDAELAAYNTAEGTTDAVKNDVTAKHYLTAPVFFENVAWRKVETVDAEYKAESFNAVETLAVSGGQISLYFVPMVSGTFDGWCQFGGPSDYKDLKATGNTALSYEGGGHPGITGTFAAAADADKQMVLQFNVSADHDVSLEGLATRNADYNGNDKGSDSSSKTVSVGGSDYAGNCFWGKCETGNAPQVLPWVKAEEPSDAEFVFKSYAVDTSDAGHDHDGPTTWVASGSGTQMSDTTGITMHQGYAHIFKFESASDNTEKHYFTAPELYAASVFRKAMDSVGEYKADYFKAVEVLPGKWTSLFMVPMETGEYDVTCTEDDHASLGMVSKVTVVSDAP